MLAVHDVMKLKVMEEFRLIAGASGLDRQVTCPGIVDTEDLNELKETIRQGEFLITKFQLIKDQPELIATYVKEMIEGGAACLVLKSTYFNELPEDAKQVADAGHFPVFVFDTVYIDQLIIELNTALKTSAFEERNSELIEEMLKPNMPGFGVRELALSLNRQFKENYVVWFLKESIDGQSGGRPYFNYKHIHQILGDASMVLKYKDGYLILASYDEVDANQIEETLSSLLASFELKAHGIVIGKSEGKMDLGKMAEAIREACHANDYALTLKKTEGYYPDMGIYQLLVQMKNDPRVFAYYEPHIKAIKDYDTLNDTDLLKTAIAFVNAEGDIQKAAKTLYQHANTVRYRIRRIAKLIGGEQMKGLVYENLTLIIRLYLLNEHM